MCELICNIDVAGLSSNNKMAQRHGAASHREPLAASVCCPVGSSNEASHLGTWPRAGGLPLLFAQLPHAWGGWPSQARDVHLAQIVGSQLVLGDEVGVVLAEMHVEVKAGLGILSATPDAPFIWQR